MKAIRRNGGYSTDTANNYIDSKQPIYSLSTELELQHKWQDNRPTDEVIGYRAWFSQEGLEPFAVKFTSQIKLPSYLSKVRLDSLEACEVRNKVYFKADSLKEVK
ncbi:MAG: hypothetical protein J6583_10030 [Gilliamella sp.]|nr:hypothetical protein [Gilliamella sp.]